MIKYILIILIAVLFLYFKIQYSYWKKKNVPHIRPTIPFGNFQSFFNMNKSFGEQIKDMYDYFKKLNTKHAGYYHLDKPIYLPIDIDINKAITIQDFEYFNEKPTYKNEKDQPMSVHLFNMGGNEWRQLRHKMTPSFTSVKLKMMLETLLSCCKPLLETISEFADKQEAMDVKEITSKFTTDVIGLVAFGIDCNSLKNPNAQFRNHGKAVIEETLFCQLKLIFATAFPRLANKMHIVNFPTATETFFRKVVMDTIKFREDNNIKKNDFMQLLINLRNDGILDSQSEEFRQLTIDELIGQAFIFFLAGFETSASAITFCLYEMAQNFEIQDKVRKEIHDVLKIFNGEICYDALLEMKYMKQVIYEALRKYPPLTTIERQCNAAYTIPNTDVILERGTSVVISILGLHRDPDYFPEPNKFDPERFSPKNISKTNNYFMPFGAGPRTCIGQRFGIMQAQVGLIIFLENFKYALNKCMKPSDDIALSFVLSLKQNILLDITKLK